MKNSQLKPGSRHGKLVRDRLATHTPKSQSSNKAAAGMNKRSNSAKWLYNSSTYASPYEEDEDDSGGSPGGGTASGVSTASGGNSGPGESSGEGAGGLGSEESSGGGLSGGLKSGEGFGVDKEFHLYDDPDIIDEVT